MIITVTDLRDTLVQRLESFRAELVEWKVLSNLPKWARHQSQILRLNNLFSACGDALSKQIAALDSSVENALPLARSLDKKILQAHAFWSYFRDKFAQRYSSNLSRYLLVADEFSWRCFEPCLRERDAVLAKRGEAVQSKSPPLVYLGQAVSPFVYPRGFELDIPGINESIFQSILSDAPLSIVSLPFYQTTHLPDTMVLGHEIGHVVEFDLGLGKELDEKVNSINFKDLRAEQLAYWRSCRVEAFADAFGAVVGGTAFLLSMAYFLAKEKPAISRELMKHNNGNRAYPTVYLRVRLCYEVLKKNGGGAASPRAEAFMKKWAAAYGDHLYSAYENEIDLVAETLVASPLEGFGGKSVRDVAKGMDASAEAVVEQDVANAFKGIRLQSSDPRVLFAVASIAYYENSSKYVAKDVQNRVMDVIRRKADDAPRRAGSITKKQSEADRQGGQDLLSKLG